MKEKHTWIIISLDCKVQEVLSKGAKSSPHLKTCYFYFENISVGSTAIFSVALRPGRCPQLHSSPHYSPGNHRSSWVHLLFAPPWPCLSPFPGALPASPGQPSFYGHSGPVCMPSSYVSPSNPSCTQDDPSWWEYTSSERLPTAFTVKVKAPGEAECLQDQSLPIIPRSAQICTLTTWLPCGCPIVPCCFSPPCLSHPFIHSPLPAPQSIQVPPTLHCLRCLITPSLCIHLFPLFRLPSLCIASP